MKKGEKYLVIKESLSPIINQCLLLFCVWDISEKTVVVLTKFPKEVVKVHTGDHLFNVEYNHFGKVTMIHGNPTSSGAEPSFWVYSGENAATINIKLLSY